jgi:virulence-associated protein VapD
MYAVAFDLVVADTEKHHPKGVTQAYTEIAAVLGEHGFRRVQGSLQKPGTQKPGTDHGFRR